MSWPQADIELATKLWKDGLSAGRIAKEMPRYTRNAVVGQISRLGLKRKTLPSDPVTIPPVSTAPPVEIAPPTDRQIAPKLPPVPAYLYCEPIVADSDRGTATVLTIGKNMCKWPIGDPSSDNFTLCGRRCLKTYCDEHSEKAYRPRTPSQVAKERAGLRY